uniref:Uncharacterized protein n=1 Tax=Arundo donax TaxID=35708 RepID=A0A0A9G8P1_ARUDO
MIAHILNSHTCIAPKSLLGSDERKNEVTTCICCIVYQSSLRNCILYVQSEFKARKFPYMQNKSIT